MKRLFLLPIACLATAACGSHVNKTQVENNAQTKRAVAFTDKVGAKCLSNPYVLHSHAGRVQVKTCAESFVPPAKRQAFGACVSRVVFSGLPTKARFEAGLGACAQKAGI